MQLSTENNIKFGMTFSQGIINYNTNNKKNIFEEIITAHNIEEDDNLSKDEKTRLLNLLNSDINPFEKRLRIMRSLDKEKDFSSKIALILQKKLSKMEMVQEILTIFRDEYTKKDILKKDFGEVLTPFFMVKEMISQVDEEFWNSPYDENGNIKTILETSNGSGIFLWCVVYKFMYGLRTHFIDEDERYKFIIENMIYACELQNSKMFNWLCTADLYDEYDLNVYCGSYLENGFDIHMREVWGVDRFSLCVSNPPYQETIEGSKRARPIYNEFIEKSIEFSDKILFITPSRWLAGGFGLDNFRNMMFSRNDIKLIRHFDDATKIFGNSVEIKGGVSYFMIDKKHNGLVNIDGKISKLNKYDIFVDLKYYNLLDKILENMNNSLKSISKSKSFWMNFNDNELDNIKSDSNILCYVSKNKGLKKYINPDELSGSSRNLIDKFKVFTPYAAGSSNNLGNFGNKIIGYPNEVCSNTYMTLLTNSENESKSLISYMNTKFCNFFLSLRKNTQNMKPDTFKWIPLVELDRQWTDDLLFEYFNLTEEEQELILQK